MSETKRRIVVTGVGTVTPLGTGNSAFWQGLAAGKSGVRKIQAFDTGGQQTQIAAEVVDFDPKTYVKQRKSLKVMARDIQLAVGAAHLAVENAAIDTSKVESTRFGVNCGAGLISTELAELGTPIERSLNGVHDFSLKKWGAEGLPQLFPLWMLKYLPNMPACHISIFYDAQGPNNSITAGEASSILAMGEAFRVIARGAADLFITGGTDSKIHPLSLVRLALLNRLSRRPSDEANRACRPFDAARDGLVAGEGSAMFLFEELEHAKKRGAKILAEIIGFGSSCQPSNPSKAVERALARSLVDAGITPSDLGFISANACSTVDGDQHEAAALHHLLGDQVTKVPVVAFKSYFGQLAAGAGAVELAACLLAAEHETLPGTLNFEAQESGAPPLNIQTAKSEFPQKPFVTYNLSHGGQCGALVVRPFTE